MREPVDSGGQGCNLRADAQRPAECGQDSVSIPWLEMREVPLAVVHRLVAVAHPGVIHLLEQFVVNGAECLYSVPDLPLIQMGAGLPQVPDHRLPFL